MILIQFANLETTLFQKDTLCQEFIVKGGNKVDRNIPSKYTYTLTSMTYIQNEKLFLTEPWFGSLGFLKIPRVLRVNFSEFASSLE